MMRRIFIHSILPLLICTVFTSVIKAQSETEEPEPPEWYINPPESDDIVVSSGDTFEMAVIKALGEVAFKQNSGSIPEGMLGNFSIETLEPGPENSKGQKTWIRSNTTTVKLHTGKDSLHIQLLEDGEKGFYESISGNLTFADLVLELVNSGIKLEYQTGITRSYVKLRVSLDQLLYTKFKKSKAFEELEQNLKKVQDH